MSIERLPIDAIRIDGGTQQRDLSEDAVADYADRIDELPPVDVLYDGKDYWLWDGFHRWHGSRRAGLTHIQANVSPGSQRDAFIKSLGANEGHGVRRTNADKRATVERALKDKELGNQSDQAIAKLCRVSHHLVADVRAVLTRNSPSEKSSERTYVTRHGTTATMNTENIGKGGDRQGKAEPGTAAPPPAADPLDNEGCSDFQEDDPPAPAADKPAPAEKASGPQTPEESEPWSEFNTGVDRIVSELRSLRRELAGLLEADAKGGKLLRSRWAHYYSYTGTLGAFDSLIRYLNSGRPIQAAKESPGYVSAERLEIVKQMAPGDGKAAGRVA